MALLLSGKLTGPLPASQLQKPLKSQAVMSQQALLASARRHACMLRALVAALPKGIATWV